MIVGHIQNLEKELYRFPEPIKRVLMYLKNTDFEALPDGRYELEGDSLFAMVSRYCTSPRHMCRAETHARYIDVQYIARGEELMGYCASNPDLKVEEDCLKERDAVFYEALVPESDIMMSEGMYAIVYPNDVHRPSCQIDEPLNVLKVVVKVSVALA